jgi:hypothetical protein
MCERGGDQGAESSNLFSWELIHSWKWILYDLKYFLKTSLLFSIHSLANKPQHEFVCNKPCSNIDVNFAIQTGFCSLSK